ncbi:MAG: radical SAM protein [Polyangiaceae bacterium]
MSRKSLVLNPPHWIERGTRSDPLFASLAAFELLSALRAQVLLAQADHDVCWLDAFTQPGSGLVWNGDVGVLGGGVEALLTRVPPAIETAWVVCAECSHHAEADLLALVAGLKARGVAIIHLVLGSGESCSEALRAEVTRSVRFDDALQEAGGRVVPRWDTTDLEALGAFHERVAKGLGWPPPNGLVLPVRLVDEALDLARMGQLARAQSLYLLDFDASDAAERTRAEALAEACLADGPELIVRFEIGAPGQSATRANEILAVAMDLWDRFRAYPDAIFEEAGSAEMPASLVADFKWTFDRRRSASSGPEKVIMNLTYACNNHCTFCAVGTRTQLHGHTASQREHLLEYRKRGVTMVDFDGGEPTLHPDLLGTLRYAKAIGYRNINVTTNGRLAYYDDFARKLVNSGLTTLLFSVHGANARAHAQQVGVAEAFEQTTGGIKNCVKHAPPGVALGMNVTLTKSNTAQLGQLCQLAWDLGLRWINIQFLTPFGRATKMIAPDTAEAAAITMQVIDEWKDRMKVQIINLPFCYMPGYEAHLEGDLLKLARHMIFVNNEDVNLAEYLAERRVRKPECEGCSRAVFCGGFYELESVPEPPWLVSPEDLVKKPTHAGSAAE